MAVVKDFLTTERKKETKEKSFNPSLCACLPQAGLRAIAACPVELRGEIKKDYYKRCKEVA
jgi:hypothetical protein